MATTKLTDAQRVILAAAGARETGLVLPLLHSLGNNRGTLGIILKSLLTRGLITERGVLPDEEVWRETEEMGGPPWSFRRRACRSWESSRLAR